MLLLGGFAIAGALSKHFIAKSMATAILSRVGRQPHWVLLANMLVATFLSMFISNVAAPVLCFGLVQPLLRTYAAGNKGCLLTVACIPVSTASWGLRVAYVGVE